MTISKENRIYLYGPSGSGKSTVGRILADRLGYEFINLDQEIEDQVGRSISEIFVQDGENAFRQIERFQIAKHVNKPRVVISLGGGALLDGESRRQVEESGQVICLMASIDQLLQRLQASAEQRPLLAGNRAEMRNRLEGLLARRAEHYQSFPFIINTSDRSVEQVVQEIQIRLGWFHLRGMGPEYDVIVRAGVLENVGYELSRRGLKSPIALVTDENVGQIYAGCVMESLQKHGFKATIITIPAGEEFKNIQTINLLWESFVKAGLERSSTVLALGGGVVTDLAGFAAATFLRGVKWAAISTTLLGMVDASLGGKTGADLPQGKNLIGAFYSPSLVLSDPNILKTLSQAQLRSGMAEVVKHAIIGDPQLYYEICSRTSENREWLKQESLEAIVRRAVAVKVKIVLSDPFEQGLRQVLNLGHTVGHAIELVSGYRLSHGEAVGIGMVVEARLSEKIQLARSGLSNEIAETLCRLGLATRIPLDLDRQAIIEAIKLDKKRASGKVMYALPVAIGEVRPGIEANVEIGDLY
ncbi:MAG TPA: 3-dehydroquinate synthase [Anaerolineaceae bacterium]|nr:3-dehydroquinate synthase [Anaerolineaceae bacterium]